MHILLDGKAINIDKPTKVIDLIDNKDNRYVGCKINTKVRSLTDVLEEDSTVELLDLKTTDGIRIYQASLRYLITLATKNVLPKAKIIYSYSVSRSIFASVTNLGHALNVDTFNLIRDEVYRLIKENYPINHITMDKKDVIKYYESMGYYDKIKNLRREKRDVLNMYECQGYLNYMYTSLVPYTSYLTKFELRQYAPGFLIIYPRSECGGELPQFMDERSFRAALKEANRWVNIIKSESIPQMNEIIDSGKALELINLCETRHNAQLTHLGDKIEDHIDNIKVICVAGPSSSGKTTFTNRLRIELESRGIEPFMISMDDFYKNCDYPLDENGKPDYEHIEALNLGLFDNTILRLVSGEEARLPRFDFTNKSISFTDPVKLKHNQVILLEGIHGLNPNIIPSIPDEQKYRIYIAPLGQFRYDIHNPISISDLRLIRRIVRDNLFRSTDINKTIESWKSVRKGEFRWIYPFQNNADFVFNSELSYEIPVLKGFIVPQLEKIDSNSPNYNTAIRLLKFLNYFSEITDKWVPTNSILREFIGNSIFYTTDKK